MTNPIFVRAVCLCIGSIGPFFAGYMLNGGHSWRLFFWVEFAFAGALFILAFFVVEETTYHRKKPEDVSSIIVSEEGEKQSPSYTAESASSTDVPPRKTFVQTLKFWGVWEKDSDFFMMIVRSFTYFAVPHVFWVISTYGE